MAEIASPKRVTRDTHYFNKCLEGIPLFDFRITQIQAQILGFIVAMEIEKRSKFQNDPITLNLNDESERANSSKRKEGSKPTVNETKIDKRRKVNNVVSGRSGKM
ncbi:hypothetical protein AABB24_038648 [Solanum stoloniferum]|uniref:Uncharacterized protein n=1 Tax=Solanum stoloniferum TaxID=62892 RepID=A0ABD2QZ42_9SOLN